MLFIYSPLQFPPLPFNDTSWWICGAGESPEGKAVMGWRVCVVCLSRKLEVCFPSSSFGVSSSWQTQSRREITTRVVTAELHWCPTGLPVTGTQGCLCPRENRVKYLKNHLGTLVLHLPGASSPLFAGAAGQAAPQEGEHLFPPGSKALQISLQTGPCVWLCEDVVGAWLRGWAGT